MSFSSTTKLEIISWKQVCDIKKLAVELTRKQSLEQLGYDCTNLENLDRNETFNVYDFTMTWDVKRCAGKALDTDSIINCIVYRFPDVEFILRFYWDGHLVETEYIKGDYREKLIQRTLDIGVDSPDAFAKLAGTFNEEQHYPFFIFPLPDLTISKVESEIENTLARVAKAFPNMNLYCILVHNNECEGFDFYKEKGILKNGKIEWKNILPEEEDALYKTKDPLEVIGFNQPNEEVYKILFVDSYKEEFLARIATEEAEEKATASGLEIEQDDGELPF